MISTTEIENILATFKTKKEKINYLNAKIFEYELAYQESLILDKDRLDRLTELTKEEEERHQQNVDRGGLPRYFNKGENDLYAQRKRIEGRQKKYKVFAEALKVLRSKVENDLEEKQVKVQTVTEQKLPKTFEELFYKPENAEPCLNILRELQPPVIDGMNNYIGKAKGVLPLWVSVLKNHKPEPLIKHFKDTIYKDLLNQKINGLNLSIDATEFRKQYKRLENNKIELDIRTLLSQYSQKGKLGK
jgi:hypothetical protein